MREPCKAEKIAVMTAVKPKTSWKCSLGMLLLNRSREPIWVSRAGPLAKPLKSSLPILWEHFVSSEMAWKGSAHMKKLAGNSCGFQEMQDNCHRLDFLCAVTTTRNMAQTWMDAGQLLCCFCYFYSYFCSLLGVFVEKKTILDYIFFLKGVWCNGNWAVIINFHMANETSGY